MQLMQEEAFQLPKGRE